MWVLIVVVLFAAGYFTGDMVAKNKARKLAEKKPSTTTTSTGVGGSASGTTG